MQTIAFSFAQLTDEQLLTEVHSLVARERQMTARLIASLAELETRGLHLCDGCQSLFTYCTQRLRLSESEAYSRIGAARTARKWPLVLELLADGSITTNRDFSTINVARSNSELRRQPPARGRAARTGAVQGAVHDQPRDSRHATPRPGSAAAFSRRRRPGRRLRASALAAPRGSGKEEVRSDESSSTPEATPDRVASRAGGSQAGSVDER